MGHFSVEIYAPTGSLLSGNQQGLEPFALHEEFEASRGPVASTAPGEPKQAKAWLARLGKEA